MESECADAVMAADICRGTEEQDAKRVNILTPANKGVITSPLLVKEANLFEISMNNCYKEAADYNITTS
jgi:hypothetical protein